MRLSPKTLCQFSLGFERGMETGPETGKKL
jgi:hypothetical protein